MPALGLRNRKTINVYKSFKRASTALRILSAAAGTVGFANSLWAANGTFTFTSTSSSWSDPNVWLFQNPYPNGINESANFTAVDLAPGGPATHSVILDVPVTLGTLVFSDVDPSTPGGWNIFSPSAKTITLDTGNAAQPNITVNSLGNNATYSYAQIQTALVGNSGFSKSGVGLLYVSGGRSSLSGSISINDGTLQLKGATPASANIVLNGGNLALMGGASVAGSLSMNNSAGTVAILGTSTLSGSILGETGKTLNVIWASSGQTLNIGSLNSPTFAGKIAPGGNGSGTILMVTSATAGSSFDLSSATLDFGNATTTFGFNQGSVTVTMPYISGGSNSTIGKGANNRGNHYLFGAQGGNQVFNGTLTDGGSPSEIVKTGNGSFTLASAAPVIHNFTGDLRVQTGTFVLGNNAALSATKNIRLEGGNLAIAGNGTISSTATITLSQTGLLDVTQVSSGFSTPPNVILSGTGEVIGGYRHNAGTLEPGGAGHAGTITFSSLANPSAITFGSGVINLDIAKANAVGGGINDLLVVNGDVGFSPLTNFRLNFTGAGTLALNDDYPIIVYSGNKSGFTGGSGATSTTSGIVSSAYRVQFSLKNLGSGYIGAHVVTISSLQQNIRWIGDHSNIWDQNYTPNFQVAGIGTNFFQGDSVTFDNAGVGSPTVLLTNAVYVPSQLVFNHDSNVVNYILSGAGTITGDTGLLKSGTGTATINTANTFTGNTTISGGVLSQGDFAALRYGTQIIHSPFGRGTVYLGTPAGSSTVSFGNTTFVNDVNVGTGLTANINFNNGSATVLGAWKNSGTINLPGGGGNLTLFGDHSSETGTVNVIGSGITIRLGNANAAGNLFWNFVSPRTMVGAFVDPSTTEIPIGGISGSGTLLGHGNGATIVADKALVIGGRNVDSNWNGQISNSTNGSSGSGGTSIPTITSLIKAGTASLVLTGTNVNYTGDTTVRQGVLQLSNTGGSGNTPQANGGQLTGTHAIRVQPGGTFRLGQLDGTLSTAGTITTSATDLLLSADGGIIDVRGAYDTGFPVPTAFATQPGVTWAGNGGTILGNIAHNAGTISPGRDNGYGTIGTLNFIKAQPTDPDTELQFVAGAVTMDIGSLTSAADRINADTILTSNNAIVVNVIGPSAGTNSIYTLMHAGSLDTGNGNFSLDLRGRGATGTIQRGTGGAANDIQLKILTPATSDLITWNGISGATWDAAVTQNWQNHASSPDYFYHGDTVTFTNTGIGTVNLTNSLIPNGEVRIANNSGSYTFAGTGKITGAASLHKMGGGTLIILTDNGYTGGTTIDPGGTIAIGRDNFHDANGSYQTGNTNANGVLFSINKHGAIGSGTADIVNNGALVFQRSNGLIVTQNIIGTGAVYLRDFGVVELRGTNTYSGGTTISWGTLKLGGDNLLPQAGSITLTGTNNFTGGNGFNGSGRGGKIDLSGYSQTIEELNAIGSNGAGGPPWDAYIYNSATLTDAISTLTINRTGTLGINSAIRMGSEGNNAPIGQIALVKRSSGVATMNYTTTGTINTNYSGRTTINGGTLVVRGTHSPAGGTSYGTYSVNGPNLGASSYNTGGVLAGDGTITAKIEVNPGGIVAPAFGGVAPTSTLTVDSMSLNSGTILFNLTGANSDRINIVADNGWTLSGAPKVNLNVVSSLTAGTFTLVDYSGANISNLAGSAGALLQLGTINNAGTFAFNLYSNVEQSSLQLIVTQPAATAIWKVDGNGLWNNSTNWTSDPTTPNAFGSVVNFGSISSARTVTMDNPFSVGTANFTSAAGFTIAGDSSTTLTFANLAPGGGIGINVTDGSHTIISPVLFWNDGTININGGSALTISGGLSTAINGVGHSITKIGSGTLMVQGIRSTFGNNGSTALNVQQGTLRVIQKPTANAPEGTTKVNLLSIANVARLDLTNNSMVIDYGSLAAPSAILAQLRGWLNSADARLYSSSADSLHGIGFKDNLDLSGLGNNAVLNFAGATADTTSILLRYTYLGDTNVDGQVDISDLYNLASNYTPSHAAGIGSGVWQAGDFNYDGWTDLTDLSVLAKNWQAGVASPLGASLGSLLATLGLPQVAVPEPGSIGLLGLGLTGLMSRRRRRL